MTNLDEQEKEKFNNLDHSWWDPEGPLKTLHDINPKRIGYIKQFTDLKGCIACDIGCGGGILTEGLANQGAHVSGVDAAENLIKIAKKHALDNGQTIDYRVELSNATATSHEESFDLVTCLELIEHVPDPEALIADCERLLKPGGTLVISTLNRNPVSYALGIVAAEYILKILPIGTHDYSRFLKPSEIAKWARHVNLELQDVSGLYYNPLTRSTKIGGPPIVNYLATFIKEKS